MIDYQHCKVAWLLVGVSNPNLLVATSIIDLVSFIQSFDTNKLDQPKA
jgi:hypothetical protein